MKVVIDIDKEFYGTLKNGGIMITGLRSDKTFISKVFTAVANGIPLPKNHGRLIDEDALKKSLFYDSRQAFTKHQVWLMFSKYNTKVPTVLEADKEE